MRCPFLRDARVSYCRVAAVRKMIVASARDAVHERCSSAGYVECPAAAARLAREPIAARCPFLEDAAVQYCAAESIRTYVPANDAATSCCNSTGYHYCESYLAASPGGGRSPRDPAPVPAAGANGGAIVVDGIPVPRHLWYAPNHMWLDVAEDGRCHVGVDGFFARAAGRVDAIGFAAQGPGCDQAHAVLTVNGLDMHLVFPVALAGVSPNVRLRSDPARLTSDPYGAGWLFAGTEPPMPGAPVGAAASAGLIGGESAARWIFAETDRLAAFVHEAVERPRADGLRLAADGGRVAAGVAQHLDRGMLVRMFEEFFSPHLQWRAAW